MNATTDTRNTVTTGAGGALLERPTRTTSQPHRIDPARRRSRTSRLGSQQVVSVRGVRIVQPKADPQAVRFTALILAILLAGIAFVVWLSATTTEQALTISRLHQQAATLDHQIEVLERDTRAASSTADIARRATDLGMIVADEPGIISVAPDGTTTILRDADPAKTLPLVNLSDNAVRMRPASTAPEETAPGHIVPQVPPAGAPTAPLPAVAPYEPNIRDRQAPVEVGQ